MNCRHSHGTWYSVLGPRQRRLLLTHLLVEYGRPVSPAELCPTLWPEDTPTAAVLSVLSVRVHISRLRADLEPDRQGEFSVLVSGAYGYAVKISPQARDTYAFEQSVDRARGALGQQDLALTRQEIDAARQDARELQTTIRLQQGDMERAVHVAQHLTVTAPLREVSWALLMRAPYGAERPVEALRQYERFRGILSRELGLDPSHGLRKPHTSVLCHDTAVLGAPRPSRSVSTLTTPPRAISPLTTPLVGRGKEVAQLHALLGAAAPGHVQWAVVSGDPGSGKTRLLDEAAAQATRTGFDVIWAGGGRGPDTDRTAALHGRDTRPTDEPRPHGGVDGAPDGTGTYPATTLVREVTRAPVLCGIDDLDRADPAVAERLGRLTTLLRDEPVVFLCALPQPAVTTVSGLLAEPARLGTSWLYLEPLTVADVRQLLAERGENVHDAEAQQGNPFTLGGLLKLPAAQRCGPLGTHGRTAPGSCCTPRSRVSSSTGAAPTRHGSPAISERPARWARSRNPFRVSDPMK
ncbi:BTAD domain-containing putative transcriptional regulator [Streptomyces coelicoflavus]|uniref:BTAD domain-containing putative transcriptional regulator n=1 Tax=Streptomyces coelicoflavus TaxID=285562 RepID=UPI003665ABAB